MPHLELTELELKTMWLVLDARDYVVLDESLHDAHQALAVEITKISDMRLDDPILKGFSSIYATLHGVVQHNLYHAGQIAVIKKAI